MKFTKYFIALAAVFGMASCSMKEDMVMLPSAEDVVAPVLEALDGPISITPTNMGLEKVTFSWTPADYGVATEVNYSIEAEAAGTKVVIVSGINDTTTVSSHINATVTYDALNQILFNDLMLESGLEEEVAFSVSAKVGNSAKVYSNVIKVLCTVTAAEKVYPKVWVIGDYCGWSHDQSQFLFDFAGDDKVYQGVVDFGEKAANGWKVTGVGKWDDTCNWGGDESIAYEPEAEKTQLINGGGSKDLKHYSKRFYHFSFDKGTLLLTKTIGFDQIGVIGDFNSWSTDVVMSFNATKQKFYADIEVAQDGGFKFRLDADWAVSYGSKTPGILDSGDNIPVTAGNYRVYLNMNNFGEMTYELNEKMFGKDEPVADAPVVPEEPDTPVAVVGWSLIGAFNSWAGDLMLTSDGTYHVVKGVELEGELKFRKDGQWNYKDESGTEIQTNFGLAEGVSFAANTELAVVGNGANILVTAGTYDVYLDDVNGKAWFITDGSYPGGGAAPEASEWGVVGDVNGWGSSPDIAMYKTATEGLFVAYNAQLTAGGIKIRANNEWNDAKNYGLASAGSVEVDHAYDLICGSGSQNMTIAAGTYDIWFDLKNSKVYIMTPGKPITEAEGGSAVAPDPSENVWGIVGDVNGWAAPDITLEASATEGLFVAYKVTMPAGGFKIRANGVWNDAANYGLAAAGPVEVDHVYDLVCSGGSGDMKIAAGTYDIWFDLKNSKVYIMTPDKPITEAK